MTLIKFSEKLLCPTLDTIQQCIAYNALHSVHKDSYWLLLFLLWCKMSKHRKHHNQWLGDHRETNDKQGVYQCIKCLEIWPPSNSPLEQSDFLRIQNWIPHLVYKLYARVKFYPWFKLYFLSCYHILAYQKPSEKSSKLNHNILFQWKLNMRKLTKGLEKSFFTA